MAEIREGWYLPAPTPNTTRTRHPRWVLGVMGGVVRYSNGRRHGMCKVTTFLRWVKSFRCTFDERGRAERPPL
jgi:hypothetical protein